MFSSKFSVLAPKKHPPPQIFDLNQKRVFSLRKHKTIWYGEKMEFIGIFQN